MATDHPAYVENVPGNPGYDIIPLLRVGNEVPLIQGTIGNYQVVSGKTFAMTGIPDGMGVFETANNYYLFLNHEIADLDSRGNPIYSSISSTVPGRIQGSRVSLFVFDKNWNIIGGKNLIEKAVDSTGQYTLNTETGNYVNPTTGNALSFTRFCSGYLAENGFVDANGQPIPIYFAPEETNPIGRGWAVSPDGVALAIEGLGRYAKENIVAASQYRATNSERTVLISTEDYEDGEIYMFVGEQTIDDRNGFRNGQLYVLKVETALEETLAEGVPTVATWTPVPKEIALGSGEALSNWVNAAGRSTDFERPEDIHEDPRNPGTFYFVTTGTKGKLVGTGDAATPGEAENPYGKMYRFSLNANDPTAPITNFELVLNGGPGTGVSYDNIVVTSNGKVIIQEDETAFGGDMMKAEARDAGIWSYDIASDKVTRIMELEESAIGEKFDDSSQPGQWETSGIIELDSGRNSYLFDVQAHTIQDQQVLNGRYVEGGQLVRAVWKGPDVLSATGNQVLYGYKGKDLLDATGGTGNNTLYGGQDDDTLIGSTSDRLFGDLGNDIIFAGKANIVNGNDGNDNINASGGSGNNFLRGGKGNDTIIGGSNDQLFGDLGNDVLYAGNGLNTLTGGEGADQFWIVNAVIPNAASTIADFQVGTDTIGLRGLGINSIAGLSITQQGADAKIGLLNKDVAILSGVQANTLNNSSFVFA